MQLERKSPRPSAIDAVSKSKKIEPTSTPAGNGQGKLASDQPPLIRAALTAASCALLGVAPGGAYAASDPMGMESALLFYNEADNRVSVAEAVASIIKPLGDQETLTFTPEVDIISGASPTGATPTNTSQTIGSVTTPAGELPLQKFNDQRFAIGLTYAHPLDRLRRSETGLSYSSERDYSSLGFSYSRMHDFNNKLTTLTLGVSGSADSVTPSTGIFATGLTSARSVAAATRAADPAAVVAPHVYTRASGITVGGTSGSSSEGGGYSSRPSKSKKVVDGLIGVTQVVNRRLLVQLNYALGDSSGYLTDPYKIISSVDGTTGETVGYLYEKRPDSRLRQSVYAKAVLHLPTDVIHASYRHYWDDWGIVSDTFDLQYRFQFEGGAYLQPEVRYYTQTAADFFYYALVDGAVLPTYASADYRLAQMNSTTYGLKLSIPLHDGGEFDVRASYMQQTGNSNPADAIGVQRSLNLYPGLDAYILQLGYSINF
jgi:hypothetical protein